MAPLRRHGARLSTISRHVCPRGPTSLRNCPDPNSALALSLSICCRPFVPLRMRFFLKPGDQEEGCWKEGVCQRLRSNRL